MKFVKTEDLEKGMRLARPIYNRNGVLLYDRDTKLTKQGINSIKNFNLIGIYVLEAMEPLPPMSEEDIEFERFQTMSVFGLREDMELLEAGNKPMNLENMVRLIYRKYGRKDQKISTIKNLRSGEDYSYKHSLFVAILAAAMGVRLKLSEKEIQEMIMAGLIHDMQLSEISKSEYVSGTIKIVLDYESRLQNNGDLSKADARRTLMAKVLLTADVYDDMTSMKMDKEPSSEIAAVRHLLKHTNKFGDAVVGTLVDSLKLLYPGVCVELTNGFKGIVIVGNEDNVLRPVILGFVYNEIYNLMLDDVYEQVQIEDVMKTMDKRVHIESSTIDEYMKRYNKTARG